MVRPVIVVAGRHRPHELVLLLLSLTLGIAYTVGAPPPQSAVASMPTWLVAAWALAMAVSGGVGLLAVLVLGRWREASLFAELGSMLLGSGALTLIAAAIATINGTQGSFGIAFCAAWAVANLARAWQIRGELR
jgi:hypothetical protein